MEFPKYLAGPVQPACPALDARRLVGKKFGLCFFILALSLFLAAWLETWKKVLSLFLYQAHLGSPCLCFLDYQAQISIPVIRVFSKHCLHVFTVFLLKLNALQSSDANPFDQPGCAEKLPDIDIVHQLTINKHNRK